jgi:hypothetical protein
MSTESLPDTMNDTKKIEQWSDISDFLVDWLRSNPLSGAERKTLDTADSGHRQRDNQRRIMIAPIDFMELPCASWRSRTQG